MNLPSKIITIIALLFTLQASAQTDTLTYIKGNFAGAALVFPYSSSIDSIDWQFQENLLFYVSNVRKKSYTNIAYSFSSNSVLVIHGIFTNTDQRQDLYFVFAKSLSNRGGYVGIGHEFKIGDIYLFGEVGTNWAEWTKETTYLTFGLQQPLSKPLKKRKKK